MCRLFSCLAINTEGYMLIAVREVGVFLCHEYKIDARNLGINVNGKVIGDRLVGGRLQVDVIRDIPDEFYGAL